MNCKQAYHENLPFLFLGLIRITFSSNQERAILEAARVPFYTHAIFMNYILLAPGDIFSKFCSSKPKFQVLITRCRLILLGKCDQSEKCDYLQKFCLIQHVLEKISLCVSFILAKLQTWQIRNYKNSEDAYVLGFACLWALPFPKHMLRFAYVLGFPCFGILMFWDSHILGFARLYPDWNFDYLPEERFPLLSIISAPLSPFNSLEYHIA